MYYIAYSKKGSSTLIDLHKETFSNKNDAVLAAKAIRIVTGSRTGNHSVKIVQGKTEEFFKWAIKKFTEKT